MSKKTEYKQKNERFMLDLQNKEGIHKLPKGILYEPKIRNYHPIHD